jgi:poly(ADP-ribose) glycohydrolase ARH3
LPFCALLHYNVTAMKKESILKSKFLGSMVGSALGDAIGELAFRGLDEPALRAEVARRDVLTYTDDTAMAIGLAESLTQIGRLDPQHLGDTFRVNYVREPWRGYASGPPTLFSLVGQCGISYAEAAQSLFGGQGSYGNGAAMRIAPLGLFFHDAPDLYEQARISASVTHAHPIGGDGAAVLAWAVAQAVKLAPQQPFPLESFSQGLIDLARTPELQEKLKLVRTLIAQNVPPLSVAWKWRLGSGVAMHESLPFALYAFLRHPQSFEDCLLCAILNGGDRDTLGAMACAVSGAYLGVEAIPPGWQEKLENHQYVKSLALKLIEGGSL